MIDRVTTESPNDRYSLSKPLSLPVRMAANARRAMYARFLANTAVEERETVLDVGATSDQDYEASNYLEAWYPHKHRVTATGIEDASFLETRYPGMRYVLANGMRLPFDDASFDVSHSSAVIEHVGSIDNQRRFMREMTRVTRRAVFITTPNRWFPIEFHTVLPLLHWLPKRSFRRLLSGTRYDFFSSEDHLNLMGSREFLGLCEGLEGWVPSLERYRLFGMVSNLLLTLRRDDSRAAARAAASG